MQSSPSPDWCQFDRVDDSAVCRVCGRVIANAPTGPIRAHCRPRTEPSPPSFVQKAKNFAVAAVSHVAAGMPMASDEEIGRRFAICKTCPFLKNDACVKCGCPVNREKRFLSKLAWADQKCPVGHW